MITNKNCIICGQEKPLSEYYKHKQMADGHLNKCKECTKKHSQERHNLKIKDPEWVEKEKARHREKYHRLEYKDLHKQSPEKIRETQKRYAEKYPEKIRARKALGRVPTIKGYEKHHWSYRREHVVDVIYLTNEHHNLVHRHIIYDDERGFYRTKEGILLDTKESSIEHYELIGAKPKNR